MKNNGTVQAWGKNNYGQLGNATLVDSNVPVQVIGLCPVLNAVNEILEPLSISVFPNPSNGIFTLNTKISNGEISICNLMGEIIFSEWIPMGQSTINNQTSTIDLSNQPSGIYFVNVKSEKESFAQKIIIDK